MCSLGVIGHGGEWEWVVVELEVKLVVELLEILICILEIAMNKRVIFEVTVWGDQLTVWLRNRTHVLVFATPYHFNAVTRCLEVAVNVHLTVTCMMLKTI